MRYVLLFLLLLAPFVVAQADGNDDGYEDKKYNEIEADIQNGNFDDWEALRSENLPVFQKAIKNNPSQFKDYLLKEDADLSVLEEMGAEDWSAFMKNADKADVYEILNEGYEKIDFSNMEDSLADLDFKELEAEVLTDVFDDFGYSIEAIQDESISSEIKLSVNNGVIESVSFGASSINLEHTDKEYTMEFKKLDDDSEKIRLTVNGDENFGAYIEGDATVLNGKGLGIQYDGHGPIDLLCTEEMKCEISLTDDGIKLIRDKIWVRHGDNIKRRPDNYKLNPFILSVDESTDLTVTEEGFRTNNYEIYDRLTQRTVRLDFSDGGVNVGDLDKDTTGSLDIYDKNKEVYFNLYEGEDLRISEGSFSGKNSRFRVTGKNVYDAENSKKNSKEIYMGIDELYDGASISFDNANEFNLLYENTDEGYKFSPGETSRFMARNAYSPMNFEFMDGDFSNFNNRPEKASHFNLKLNSDFGIERLTSDDENGKLDTPQLNIIDDNTVDDDSSLVGVSGSFKSIFQENRLSNIDLSENGVMKLSRINFAGQTAVTLEMKNLNEGSLSYHFPSDNSRDDLKNLANFMIGKDENGDLVFQPKKTEGIKTQMKFDNRNLFFDDTGTEAEIEYAVGGVSSPMGTYRVDDVEGIIGDFGNEVGDLSFNLGQYITYNKETAESYGLNIGNGPPYIVYPSQVEEQGKTPGEYMGEGGFSYYQSPLEFTHLNDYKYSDYHVLSDGDKEYLMDSDGNIFRKPSSGYSYSNSGLEKLGEAKSFNAVDPEVKSFIKTISAGGTDEERITDYFLDNIGTQTNQPSDDQSPDGQIGTGSGSGDSGMDEGGQEPSGEESGVGDTGTEEGSSENRQEETDEQSDGYSDKESNTEESNGNQNEETSKSENSQNMQITNRGPESVTIKIGDVEKTIPCEDGESVYDCIGYKKVGSNAISQLNRHKFKPEVDNDASDNQKTVVKQGITETTVEDDKITVKMTQGSWDGSANADYDDKQYVYEKVDESSNVYEFTGTRKDGTTESKSGIYYKLDGEEFKRCDKDGGLLDGYDESFWSKEIFNAVNKRQASAGSATRP